MLVLVMFLSQTFQGFHCENGYCAPNLPKEEPVYLQTKIEFHDAEPLLGAIGVGPSGRFNTTFKLLAKPNPPLSLMLVSDGRVLMQGIDYDLDGDSVEIIEHSVAPHVFLTAWYRVGK